MSDDANKHAEIGKVVSELQRLKKQLEAQNWEADQLAQTFYQFSASLMDNPESLTIDGSGISINIQRNDVKSHKAINTDVILELVNGIRSTLDEIEKMETKKQALGIT